MRRWPESKNCTKGADEKSAKKPVSKDILVDSFPLNPLPLIQPPQPPLILNTTKYTMIYYTGEYLVLGEGWGAFGIRGGDCKFRHVSLIM